MRAWWVAAVVLVALVIIVGAWVARARRRAAQREHDRRRFEALQPQDSVDTIFVALPCLAEEHACADTLFSLFYEAQCPWRVHVGLMHHGRPSLLDPSAHDDIVSMYAEQCRAHDAQDFCDQISQTWLPVEQARGPDPALAHLVQTLYRKERYIFTLDCHSRLAPQWDRHLLDDYRQCLTQSAHPVLTTCPPEYDTLTTLPQHAGPTYPCVARLEPGTGAPVLAPREFAVVPRVPTRVWFHCPRLCFAEARLWQQVPPEARLEHQGWAGAFWFGARCWAAGWDLFAPTHVILHHAANKPAHSHARAPLAGKATQRAWQTSAALFHQWLRRAADEDTDNKGGRSVAAYLLGAGVQPIQGTTQSFAQDGFTGPWPRALEQMQRVGKVS